MLSFPVRWSIQRSPSPIHRKSDAFTSPTVPGTIPLTPPRTSGTTKVVESKKVEAAVTERVESTEDMKVTEKEGENVEVLKRTSKVSDVKTKTALATAQTIGKKKTILDNSGKKEVKEILRTPPQIQNDSKQEKTNRGKICKALSWKLFLL